MKKNVILLGHKGYYYEYNNQKNLGDFIPKCKNLYVLLNLHRQRFKMPIFYKST